MKLAMRLLLLLLLLLSPPWTAMAEEEDKCSAPTLADDAVAEGEGKKASCGCGGGGAAAQAKPLTPPNNNNEHVIVLSKELVSRCLNAEPSDLLNLPGGQFTMGTNDVKNAYDGEGPPRQVRVSPFSLEETEVSILQFCRFVAETGHVTDAERFGWSFVFFKTLSKEAQANVTKQVAEVPWWSPVNDTNWLFPNGPDQVVKDFSLPAVHVSHHDARAYCAWLGRRLPTEAEFEYAMRGGKENFDFPWGSNEITPRGKHRANLWQGSFPEVNLVEDGYEYAAPVDAFGAQNDFGLHNIVGNVWEWVADAWITNHAKVLESYGGDGAVLEDPQIELEGKQDSPDVERVKRGGSYMCHESYCLRYRTSSRSSNSADSSAQNLGFRCAS